MISAHDELLAMANFYTPFFWGILIVWIATVVAHEFAHGIAAYYGGDYTIRERGGLSLNPLQYVDPMMSLIMPAIFLMMGGIPLPGAVTYVRNDLLRSKLWQSLVSLAGPTANFAICLILILSLNPHVGWYDRSEATILQQFVGCLAALQFLTVFYNLLPVPPLDGFGIIEPYLPPRVKNVLDQPNVRWGCYIGLFALIWLGAFSRPIWITFFTLIRALGVPPQVFMEGFGRLFHG